MTSGTIIRLLLALTVLVSAFLRPPGAMLVLDGDTFTYEICTGGEIETIKVAAGGETPKEIDIGCDFFASQIGTLPLYSVSAAPTDVEVFSLVALNHVDVYLGQTQRTLYSPRAPPVLS